jgi:type IV pilus assembly protein PilC
LLAVGAMAMLAGAYAVVGGSHGKQRRDRLLMALPVVGHLYLLISLERFCRVLAALAKAGVPLPDAIEMSAASTNNTIFVERLAKVREVLVRGGGLSSPIAETELFPTAARQMIRVGEKTGTLAVQLTKAATYYEREVAFHMKKATELFQPAVILFVGGLVGFVAVAQVSAMYSIFGQVQTP